MHKLRTRLLNTAISSRVISSIAQQILPGWVTVFMLHRLEVSEMGIKGLKPAHLSRCLEYLCKNDYRFISLENAVQQSLAGTLKKEKWVAFSLDDGFAEQVNVAGEIFARFNCPSTCFLIAGFIDGQLWQWEHQLTYLLKHTTAKSLSIQFEDFNSAFDLTIAKPHRPIIAAIRKHKATSAYDVVAQIARNLKMEIPQTPPLDERPATWDDIRAMELKGMQFAPHTVTHRIVAGLSDAEQTYEISESIARVNAECRNPGKIFCYPSGQKDQYDERMFVKLQAAGMRAAFSAQPGFMEASRLSSQPNYRYAIPRMAMPDDFDEFTRYVSWAQYIYERVNGRNSRHQSYGDF